MEPTTPPPRVPSRVDDLRDRLRALGYLDARVDRFVLAPATRERGALSIALRASLRIGALAAALLGPAAATGVALRLPALVTGPRDALVLAAYFALVAGAATTLVACAAAAAARLVARSIGRRPRTARGARLGAAVAGLAAGSACLAYLTLWWRTATGEMPWGTPTGTLFALAVAAAISLLLGHAVRVAALGIAARAADPSLLGPREPRPFWRGPMAVGLAAFGGAALLLAAASPRGTAAASAPEYAVVPTGLRVTLVAIDGVDQASLARLMGAGELPAFARLLGGAQAEFEPTDTSDPARVWTTVATGQPAEVHGVSALETRRVPFLQGALATRSSPLLARLAAATDLVRLTRPAVTDADARREKTFWEVAAEKGLRTAVVNWWATWPASREAGTVVSDRAMVRLERGGDLDAEVAPPDLYRALRTAYAGIDEAARRAVAAAFASVADPHARAVVERSGRIDAALVALARHRALGRLDLRAVYLPGLDLAQHALLGGATATPLPASLLVTRLAALDAYYAFLDTLIARAAEETLGPDTVATANGTLLLVVALPGRVAGGGGGRLFLVGPGARPGARALARVTDVAPTVLYALGLPASRALAGRPLVHLFDEAFQARYPLRTVASYGARHRSAVVRGRESLDQEILERLRSLGYLR